jgi:Amt family ammonium transporter
MPETPLLFAGLAWLVPLGFALIAAGGLPEEQARQATLSALAALALSAIGYVATGFALQYGGIGLLVEQPGFDGLVWEWSALGPTWGRGWGMAGMAGWGLAGAAATPAAYGLALANLPWVATAGMIPLVSLRGRIPAWAAGLIGLLVGAMAFPLAGNWIWGGGWLANLGANLGLGHGLVDPGGAGLVHLLGAAAALAGLLVFVPTRRWARHAGPVPLPPVHLPLLAVTGAGLLLVGGVPWMLANPLLNRELDFSLLALNMALAPLAGALVPLVYVWFVAGRADPLMATRGFGAGQIAAMALAPFAPPWAVLAAGATLGLLVPFTTFLVDRILRLDDPTAALAVHGLGGAFGLLAVGILADGRNGLNWNGVGAGDYLNGVRQGVTGLVAGEGMAAGATLGQLQAQGVGLAAVALLGFFTVWLAVAPPAIVLRLIQARGRELIAARARMNATVADSKGDEPAPIISVLASQPEDGAE